MTASDWDEIKRLASDFNRIQLSSSVQKLSERNCIEIVQKLIDLGKLDVIFTTDGKEYLTPFELSKEILEELAVSGGRISLVDLHQRLKVDFRHIEHASNDLLRSEKSLRLVLGELINRDYFDHLCEEINDKLQQQGLVSLNDVARDYMLPSDNLNEILKDRLGHSIKGQLDEVGEHIYTQGYLSRQQSIIRGIFSSILRPTNVYPIITKLGLNERLFYSILDKLISSGQICGSTSVGRPYNAVYTPNIYLKCQQEWIESFFNQNSYLEYDGLARLGISDGEGYAKKKFKNRDLEFLKTCCIGSDLKERIEVEMEEALEAGTFFEVLPHLPSICTKEDARMMTNILIKKKSKIILLGDDYLVDESFIEKIIDHLKPKVAIKAEKTIIENPSILTRHDKIAHVDEDTSKEDRKDQRKKKSTGSKGVSGTQGREVKTKVVKKKYNAHGSHKGDAGGDDDDFDDHDDDRHEKKKQEAYTFMTIKELSSELAKLNFLSEAGQELCELLALRIIKDLNRMYNEELKNVFLQSANIPSTSTLGGAPNKKKMFAETSEKIVGLWSNAKLFEKGILKFKDDIQALLNSHLLRTVCTDLTNLVFSLYAAETMVNLASSDSVTNEEKMNILAAIKNEKTKSLLTKLKASLNSKGLDDFFLHFEGVCAQEFLNIPLKRNKNKDRQLLFGHRQSLTANLATETNPALVLHISSILIFYHVTGCMIHASGKFVPHIIAFLKADLNEHQHKLLFQMQELVIKQIKVSSTSDESSEEAEKEVKEALDSLIPQIKELPLAVKNASDSVADDE